MYVLTCSFLTMTVWTGNTNCLRPSKKTWAQAAWHGPPSSRHSSSASVSHLPLWMSLHMEPVRSKFRGPHFIYRPLSTILGLICFHHHPGLVNWWGLGFTFYALDLALSLQEEYGAEESHVATHALGVGTLRMVGLGEYMVILMRLWLNVLRSNIIKGNLLRCFMLTLWKFRSVVPKSFSYVVISDQHWGQFLNCYLYLSIYATHKAFIHFSRPFCPLLIFWCWSVNSLACIDCPLGGQQCAGHCVDSCTCQILKFSPFKELILYLGK